MKINTAELKNNLSRYLRRVRETGETIIVCERNRPIARLQPVSRRKRHEDAEREVQREREALLAKARALGIDLRLPKQQKPMRQIEVTPERAPDGRTDIATIEWLREGRSY